MKLNYFNFKKYEDKYLLINDFGKHIFLDSIDFKKLVNKDFSFKDEILRKLIDRNFIYNETDISYSAKHKYDIRELKGHVNTATSLHIFVVTTACNLNCIYCQANNGKTAPNKFMSIDIAKKAVDVALQSPEKNLSFEFQGGEPLLNFKTIKAIVEYTEIKKAKHIITYSIVSNLTLLNEGMLQFFKIHNFSISTSLDGNECVHNNNRKLISGEGTYNFVVKQINNVRKYGLNIGAIETTTKYSLTHVKDIIAGYVDLKFNSIFIRPLTQLGKALVNWNEIGYTAEDYLEFYKNILDELININKNGTYIREEHTTILLRRINGYFINYMELRSPCGASIGQLAYFSDGNVFTCDEGRMFYEMGDNTFLLGNVNDNSFNEIINNNVCKTVCKSSMLETIPSCCDCVYQSYCGVCPIVNYAKYNDIVEKEPRTYRCRIYNGMLDYIFSKYYNNDIDAIKVFDLWSKFYD